MRGLWITIVGMGCFAYGMHVMLPHEARKYTVGPITAAMFCVGLAARKLVDGDE